LLRANTTSKNVLVYNSKENAQEESETPMEITYKEMHDMERRRWEETVAVNIGKDTYNSTSLHQNLKTVNI
jgi:hypothetical protein